MKYTQKTKYFVFGALATAVLAPLAIYAVETIPVTFGEGDVISATVINNVLKRVNDTQRGYQSTSEIDGAYSCTTYARWANGDPRCTTDGLIAKKSGTMTFNSSAGTWTYAGTGGWDTPTVCVDPAAQSSPSGIQSSGSYQVRSNRLVLTTGAQLKIFPIQRISPTSFRWDGDDTAFIECNKTAQPPAPADALTATVSGTSVALAWTDQSSDETGFKVQYKTSARGTWTTSTTTATNATSYTVSGLTTGKYWFRVVATNSDGDAMSSSEVQAEIQ